LSAPIKPGAEPLSRGGHGALGEVGVLVLHGFTGSPISVRPLAELLSERGFAVEMPRLPGHGTMARDLLPFRYADFLAEAAAALQRLRQRTKTQVVVGFSMGGTLALDLGTKEPLQGVVTINAQILDRGGVVVKLAPLIEKLVPLAPASAAGLKKNDIKKGGDEDAYDMVAAAAGNSIVRALPEVRARLPLLKMPLLVIYSRDDHSVPPDNSRSLPSLVGSERVTLLELLDSYHVALLDNDLPLIAERVASFAESVAKTP
jgi:carboxylesterase